MKHINWFFLILLFFSLSSLTIATSSNLSNHEKVSPCPLESFDANEDGKLNRDEYQEATDCHDLNGCPTFATWSVADANQDGWVDGNEYQEGCQP